VADFVEKVGPNFYGRKYALEIEIFTLNREFRAQISRNGTQKTRFQRQVCGRSGRTDFFNRIDRKQSIMDIYVCRNLRQN